jgi:two-component sensor histidine kinase
MPHGLDTLEHQGLVAGLPAAASRFETLARLSCKASRRAAPVIDTLLAATCPGKNAGPPVLRPIWAEEAMHRSAAMLRLLHARRHRTTVPADLAVAQDLASLFRSLDAPSAHEVVPCSTLLRDIVTDLVALSGHAAAPDITLSTNIQRLRLPAYKRRALVLATVELVINTLLHAFPRRTTGHIDVSLTMLGPVRAALEVKDNGIGFRDGRPNLGCGVAAGLADLLEAELAYFRGHAVTTAEVVFPVSDHRAFQQ